MKQKNFISFAVLLLFSTALSFISCDKDETEKDGPQTVQFEMNGGIPTIEAMTIETGQKIRKPADPVKTGYAFTGWFKEASLSTLWDFENDVVGTKRITLYAGWTDNFYTITLNPNGGVAGSITSMNVLPNTTKDLSSTEGTQPTRTGYAFDGWYKEAAGVAAWTSADKVTTHVTLYAKWILLRTVTFDSQGGSSTTSISVKPGDLVIEPIQPTRANYEFMGWYQGADWTTSTKWNFATMQMPGSNITLYAGWAPTQTLSLYYNDGTTDFQTSSYPVGVTKALKEPIARANYEFVAWNSQPDGTGEDFKEYAIGNAPASLYAKWKYTGVYAVGVYYPDPNVRYDAQSRVTSGTAAIGVVTTIRDGGTNGVIVSLNEFSGRTYAEAKNFINIIQYGKTWRMPSLDELKAVYSMYNGNATVSPNEAQRSAINTRLTVAGGAAFKTGDYWSSTPEGNATRLYYVTITTGESEATSIGSKIIRTITDF